MSKVIVDITMSLDGYVSPAHGSVDELQNWVINQDPVDTEILERNTAATGAVIMGRHLFDIVDAPGVWTSEMAYGAQPPGRQPFFVVTHSSPADVRLTRELGMQFSFVSGLSSAVKQARAAAESAHVVIMGGGDIIGQAIEADLVDELHLPRPLVLGKGIPLFKDGTKHNFHQRQVRVSSNAVHLVYEAARTAEQTPHAVVVHMLAFGQWSCSMSAAPSARSVMSSRHARSIFETSLLSTMRCEISRQSSAAICASAISTPRRPAQQLDRPSAHNGAPSCRAPIPKQRNSSARMRRHRTASPCRGSGHS